MKIFYLGKLFFIDAIKPRIKFLKNLNLNEQESRSSRNKKLFHHKKKNAKRKKKGM